MSRKKARGGGSNEHESVRKYLIEIEFYGRKRKAVNIAV